jgi:DNA-binding CsgD family transcriptional regulator
VSNKRDILYGLTDSERRVLDLFLEDQSVAQISNTLNQSRAKTYNLIDGLKKRLNIRNTEYLIGAYANHLGMRQFQIGLFEDPIEEHFDQGRLKFSANIISSSLQSSSDITCHIDQDEYSIPSALTDTIDQLIERRKKECSRKSIPYYNGRIFLVRTLETNHETYTPLNLGVQRARFFDWDPIMHYTRYKIDPRAPQQTDLPIALSVILHVIVVPETGVSGDNKPYLIVQKRRSVAVYSGAYGAAISGFCEVDNDESADKKQLDWVHTMWRELGEEREHWANKNKFRDGLKMLACVYDYGTPAYSFVGRVFVRDDPEAFRRRISMAKEGVYEKIEWPVVAGPSDQLRELVDHLGRERWIGGHGVGLYVLLQRHFGVRVVEKYAKERG